MGKMKNVLLESLDHNFENYSDDDLINDAFDPVKMAALDRGDSVNLIEELARRYQNLLMIIARLDAPTN